MRSFLVLLSIIIFFIFSLPLFAIEWVIGKISPRARDISLLRISQGFCSFLLFLCGTKVEYIGREHLPREGAALYILNHRSLLDIPLTLTQFPAPTGYIAKKELAGVPVLGWWIRLLYGFFLDRSDVKAALKTILAGIENLKKGISVAVCPEGTRGRGADEREMLEFHEGTFKLATKAKVPIIPVTICGSSNILEDHFPWIQSTHAIVEFGAPIDPASLTKEESKFIGRYVRGIMMETMERNHARLEQH